MAVKSTRLEEDYAVTDGDVQLSVIIGDRQFGTSLVTLDGEQLALGDVNGLTVTAPGGLRGKKLFVKSVVTDVNDQSNFTSITYELSGGVAPKGFELRETVDNDGDSVVYRATFHLQ